MTNTQTDPINPALKPDDALFGYRIESIVALKEIDAYCYRLVHTATGARHVHISRQDEENAFGVAFKTVPTDSTGVAHILEHTVLCGSAKYPVRDPFFSMLKRSLSTFMNAFTASDWTMYPFCTQNPKDFYNLMDVYLDAAFFPNIDELSFKQEGHRLEVERGPEASEPEHLVYKGVVYNEMKGAMSSPDQVLARSMLEALYPDTTYSNNSGGDPRMIPRLTHAQLKAFHQRHYHPSNAYFYTYGSLPLKDHLQFIAAKIMNRFSAIDPQTEVPAQPRWDKPRSVRFTYALAPDEAPERKSQVCLAWLVGDVRDTFGVLVFTVLEQILIGNAGSPLRKALMDSGLGSALSDATGFDADNRDTLFSCGLKDAEAASADRIEALIFDVLNRQVREGIEGELIDSAMHQIEFHRKEISNSPYPYGLKLLIAIIGSWLHGGDPGRVLQLDADLQRLREAIDRGSFLEGWIQTHLIDNPHRIRLILEPDQQKAHREEEQVGGELEAIWSRLTPEDRRRIDQDASQLAQLQERAEDLSTLPTLELSDIPPKVAVYAPTKIAAQAPLWCYAQPTSGIFYYTLTASANVPAEQLAWVPFFCYALNKMGTLKHTYTQMVRRIDAVTGGLSLSANSRALWNQPQSCLPLVSVNAKCLGRNIDAMLEIVEEFVSSVDFSDLARLEQLFGEYQAGLESVIVHNGHRLAISASSRSFSPTSALSELWGGVQHVRAIRSFGKQRSPEKMKALAADLSELCRSIFKAGNAVMAAIGDPDQVDKSCARIESSEILAANPRTRLQPTLAPINLSLEPPAPYEGWSTSTAVAFVACSLPTVALGHPDAPLLTVLSKILRSLYLHREIREKGGAYGGFALYNPENGLFSLASYRDPHIVRTLEVFSGAADFMRQTPLKPEDVKEAVLQVCSEIDKPDPPGPAARKAFSRLIVGLTDETRLQFKQELLQATPQKLADVAQKYLDRRDPQWGMAVIAGKEHLERAQQQLTNKKLKIDIL
jgi:Zn-dependent M16 (insulinase) family peptidase